VRIRPLRHSGFAAWVNFGVAGLKDEANIEVRILLLQKDELLALTSI
jgi:hypothetical protein